MEKQDNTELVGFFWDQITGFLMGLYSVETEDYLGATSFDPKAKVGAIEISKSRKFASEEINSLLIHECSHLTDIVFKHVGIKGTEIRALYQEMLVSEYTRLLWLGQDHWENFKIKIRPAIAKPRFKSPFVEHDGSAVLPVGIDQIGFYSKRSVIDKDTKMPYYEVGIINSKAVRAKGKKR